MSSFAPEVFLQVGGFPITNTVINTVLVDGVLLLLALYTATRLKFVPGKFQSIIELFIGGFYNFVSGIADKKTDAIFPIFMSFFLFIIVANFSGLVPGIGTFGIEHQVMHEGHKITEIIPFNRPTTSDLNTTLALAILSVVITNVYAIRKLGLVGYISKFFTFVPFLISVLKGKPKVTLNFKQPLDVFIAVITPVVMIFVGLLELLSEFVKSVSLSFRLFGNIYAGEVVLETAQGISAFLVPIPFMLLESLAAGIQALVFSMLTMVFMIILSTSHEEDEGHKEVSH